MIQKISLTVGGIVLTAVAIVFIVFSTARTASAVVSNSCTTVTLVSGTNSQTAGWTETNPSATPLNVASYSGGAYTGAVATQPVIPPWVNPATNSNFTGSGALWISSSTTWPGGTGNTEGSPSKDQWRLFKDSFVLPPGATVTNADVWYSADNAAEVYFDGSSVGTTNDVFGAVPGGNPANYSNVFHTTFSPTLGSNTLNFVVRNWGGNYTSNPTGLLYKAVIVYCVPPSVKVTIDKNVDGVQATAASSSSASFPMHATWNATNIGSGSGDFTLGPTGFNSPNPYEAVTSDMTPGASYSTNEDTSGGVVGASCTNNIPFALVGYTTGDTHAQAQSSTPTTTVPSFTNMTGDKFVIVWNKTCPSPVPPLSCTLSADKTTITRGQAVTLSWTSTNATSEKLTEDSGNVAVAPSGSVMVHPRGSRPYILSVLEIVPHVGAAFKQCTVQITVNQLH